MRNLDPSQSKNDHNEEVNNIELIDLILILAKNKRKIILLPIIFGTVGIIISFLLPNIYTANTKLLPPQQSQSTASAMLSQLGGLAGGAGSALGLKNPNDLYIALLKSRTVADKLIQQFDLRNRYDQKYLENTRIQLAQRTSITSGKDGIISIEVEDKDPKIAAGIANTYVKELSVLTSKFALTEASQRRAFYEKQLELTKDRMIAAENTLSENMPTSGLISVDIQSKALLETTAKLRANISAKEIQLKAMEAFVTPSSNQYKIVLKELTEMKAELSRLEFGTNNETDKNFKNTLNKNQKDIFSSKSGANNLQMLRDVKYHQMLYEMLAKQFELARLDEAKDTPIIQVLDAAIEPEQKSKPKRALISLVAFFFGLILALASAFLSEKIAKKRNEEENDKITKIKNYIKNF
jgi:uncharacterized protein involved in exopolysaccharide biosynthesis